jgi:esterase/lipase
MRAIVIGSTKHFLFALGYGLLGILAAALFGAVWTLNDRPELEPWHRTKLNSEYHQQLGFKGFDEYLQLEQNLFSELDSLTQAWTFQQTHFNSAINRFDSHSLSSPERARRNWNRSYEWRNEHAEFGIILLHGMSDSPYSLSHFAQHLKPKAHILGLRLPGHGTLPSGLTTITWPDLASAVNLATKHMKQQLNGKPLYVIGFSTGAALALNHELENIDQAKDTDYQAMIMLSPAIGLKPIAAFAKWQASLGQVLGQDKLMWNSIENEYDPYKYQSFAVNAGDVVYQLSLRNRQLLEGFSAEQKAALPQTLVFQSVVDDTVSTQAVIEHLYLKLSKDKANNQGERDTQIQHELVLFDVNRAQGYQQWLLYDPLTALNSLMYAQAEGLNVALQAQLNFQLTIVENTRQATEPKMFYSKVQARRVSTLNSKVDKVQALDLSWPRGVHSLSHVALPYPANDTVYGVKQISADDPIDGSEINIGGHIHLGERRIFSIPAEDMLRQKWNPFYGYMLSRIDELVAQ